jgi:hypothetical protein
LDADKTDASNADKIGILPSSEGPLCAEGFLLNFFFTKDITCLAPIEAIRRAVRKAGKTFTKMPQSFASNCTKKLFLF